MESKDRDELRENDLEHFLFHFNERYRTEMGRPTLG